MASGSSYLSLEEVLGNIQADSEPESDLDDEDDEVSSWEGEAEEYRTSGKDDPCCRDSVLNYDVDFVPVRLTASIVPHIFLVAMLYCDLTNQ